MTGTAKRSLVFDADGSLFASGGRCSLCRGVQGISDGGFVRIRMRLVGWTDNVAWLRPDCVGRAVVVVERHGWWRDMASSTLRAIQNTLWKRRTGPLALRATPGKEDGE